VKVTTLLTSVLLLSGIAAAPRVTYSQIVVGVGIRIAPPVLRVEVQPFCPRPNLLWTPGYWAYSPNGYYWVGGDWIAAPRAGLLWTPGYWGNNNGSYAWSEGYWGPHVGFYGGVNYGYGFFGGGFVGGEWRGGNFAYNTAVVRVNTTVIRNTYVDRTVINRTVINNHTSFNGPGGVEARPSAQEETWSHEEHVAPREEQVRHVQIAAKVHGNYAVANHGMPERAALARPAARPEEHNAAPTRLIKNETARPMKNTATHPAAESHPAARHEAPAAHHEAPAAHHEAPAAHPANNNRDMPRPAKPTASANHPEQHPAPKAASPRKPEKAPQE
jgi:hypothetical protein